MPPMKQSINIRDYIYDLPGDRIATHPLENRDESKLLVYKAGEIDHTCFSALPDLLPPNSTLFFNDTKVIPARLFFQKETGAQIELFLLNPVEPNLLLQLAMQATSHSSWKCTIGNLKRWPEDIVLTKKVNGIELGARLKSREEGIIDFEWTPKDICFAEVVRAMGVTPLPPYIKREADEHDLVRYQTVYSHHDGAVAAPTAGLHFTEKVLSAIRQKGMDTDFLTLHVSAGTFQPVKVANATDHKMHSEQIIVSKENIQHLMMDKPIVAVGTTSARTIESLYWYGVKLIQNPNEEFLINQFDAYELPSFYTKKEAIEAVYRKMKADHLEIISGKTSIYILPGYSFKVCNALITNFHQPGSTLMLLVAAFIGDDWKEVYRQALENDYRFLSFGDSSLLVPGLKA